MTKATGELRGLDQSAAADWMSAHVEGSAAPITFSLIAGGHSNLTYGATDATGRRYVLRRGPLGREGGGAHDMSREYRVIAALAATAVPVPRAYALCQDEAVTGASFYVMSRVDGAVLDNTAAADMHLPDPAARRRAGEQVVDVMADMHRVDVDAVGLGDIGRREDFLARQLHRFRQMWERNKTRELPAMTALADRLEADRPAQRYTGIVHGDYRIGNVMFDSAGTLAAVLDWELWTLGDVLADLGFVLNNWYEPDDPNPLVFMEWPPTVTGDFGTRADVLARYADRTGFDVSAVEYYRAFQHWRMAVLAEGVKRRYETAQMASTDVDFAHLDRRVLDLADLAEQHLSRWRG
ncbi:MAG TPA: phosphotransferase family protein [Mycobacteriales bacterium]|nr:phosphotransferase family protein [Mycobacteriales bacterium]